MPCLAILPPPSHLHPNSRMGSSWMRRRWRQPAAGVGRLLFLTMLSCLLTGLSSHASATEGRRMPLRLRGGLSSTTTGRAASASAAEAKHQQVVVEEDDLWSEASDDALTGRYAYAGTGERDQNAHMVSLDLAHLISPKVVACFRCCSPVACKIRIPARDES
jgi:hypothetical protein